MTTLAPAAGVVMEGTSEDGPVAVVLHLDRRTEEFFRGGEDVLHGVFYGLLGIGENGTRGRDA